MVQENSRVLVILNATNGGIIWSSTTSRRVQNPVAELLDSGNLLVRDANDESPVNFMWQSFDYPTDTLLPGMKLGKNLVTGLEVYITSWKNMSDPTSGDFTYHFDSTGYLVLKKGAELLYSSTPRNTFNPLGTRRSTYTYRVVINDNEVYFNYKLLNDSVYMRFILSITGNGQMLVWNDRSHGWIIYLTFPSDVCDRYSLCGAYGMCNIAYTPLCGCLKGFEARDPQAWAMGDWSSGCIRRTPLHCKNGDAFLKYSGIKLPDSQHSWLKEDISLQECATLCSENCSCMAYTNLDTSRYGCQFWSGDLVGIRDTHTVQYIYIRMASSESVYSTGTKSEKQKILIVTLPLVIILILMSLSLSLFLRYQKRKRVDHQLPEIGRLRHKYTDNHSDQSLKDLELPLFDLSTITKATDRFSINNKLGQGGFGPVYKGLLGEDQEIAVKCLSRTSHQGVDEFKNEIICFAKLQHRNLVKLLGCCIEGEELMLVYEYLKNRSLDLILFDPMKRSMLLEWPRRFNIINGVARGIMYLHQDSRLRVIHRDLKASNILLDSDMNPKISDFGLARTFGGNETGADTSRVVGTYGYMSPEYARDGLFSVKSDVYSFGVIVLEIVSGERNRGFSHNDHDLNLLGYAWILYTEERYLEIVDSCLRSSCCISEAMRSIHIGLLCVQEHPQDRPSMASVVAMLSNDAVLPEAKPPGFFTGREMLTAKKSVASSINTMTNSQMDGR
ncbi:S-locus lectin protein kinase family protein [Perilla frutescens var. frutescens]|nr:S-locus lectin protein kinase family protein [Perilla frutescens var. frutescens]